MGNGMRKTAFREIPGKRSGLDVVAVGVTSLGNRYDETSHIRTWDFMKVSLGASQSGELHSCTSVGQHRNSEEWDGPQWVGETTGIGSLYRSLGWKVAAQWDVGCGSTVNLRFTGPLTSSRCATHSIQLSNTFLTFR